MVVNCYSCSSVVVKVQGPGSRVGCAVALPELRPARLDVNEMFLIFLRSILSFVIHACHCFHLCFAAASSSAYVSIHTLLIPAFVVLLQDSISLRWKSQSYDQVQFLTILLCEVS